MASWALRAPLVENARGGSAGRSATDRTEAARATVPGEEAAMSHEMGMGAGTLGRGADLVGGARQDFDRLSAGLDHEIDQLRPRWQGAGGRAFFELKDAWNDRHRRVVAALDDLATAL